jgi:bacterioferritin
MVTHLGEHPSLKIGALPETQAHSINDILEESLEAEKEGLALYKKLLDLARDRSIFLEEYARKMIAEEEIHLGEVNKMLRKPGEIARFKAESRGCLGRFSLPFKVFGLVSRRSLSVS